MNTVNLQYFGFKKLIAKESYTGEYNRVIEIV